LHDAPLDRHGRMVRIEVRARDLDELRVQRREYHRVTSVANVCVEDPTGVEALLQNVLAALRIFAWAVEARVHYVSIIPGSFALLDAVQVTVAAP